VYRPRPSARPVVARGRWADDHTFVVEYNEGPGLNSYTLRMCFEGNRVLFEIGTLSLEGQLEKP